MCGCVYPEAFSRWAAKQDQVVPLHRPGGPGLQLFIGLVQIPPAERHVLQMVEAHASVEPVTLPTHIHTHHLNIRTHTVTVCLPAFPALFPFSYWCPQSTVPFLSSSPDNTTHPHPCSSLVRPWPRHHLLLVFSVTHQTDDSIKSGCGLSGLSMTVYILVSYIIYIFGFTPMYLGALLDCLGSYGTCLQSVVGSVPAPTGPDAKLNSIFCWLNESNLPHRPPRFMSCLMLYSMTLYL